MGEGGLATSLTSEEDFVELLQQIGYSGDLSYISDIKRTHMHRIWSYFFAVILKVFSTKTGGWDQVTLTIGTIAWGLLKEPRFNIGEWVFGELCHKMTEKGWVNTPVVFPRFLSIILKDHMGEEYEPTGESLKPKEMAKRIFADLVNADAAREVPPILKGIELLSRYSSPSSLPSGTRKRKAPSASSQVPKPSKKSKSLHKPTSSEQVPEDVSKRGSSLPSSISLGVEDVETGVNPAPSASAPTEPSLPLKRKVSPKRSSKTKVGHSKSSQKDSVSKREEIRPSPRTSLPKKAKTLTAHTQSQAPPSIAYDIDDEEDIFRHLGPLSHSKSDAQRSSYDPQTDLSLGSDDTAKSPERIISDIIKDVREKIDEPEDADAPSKRTSADKGKSTLTTGEALQTASVRVFQSSFATVGSSGSTATTSGSLLQEGNPVIGTQLDVVHPISGPSISSDKDASTSGRTHLPAGSEVFPIEAILRRLIDLTEGSPLNSFPHQMRRDIVLGNFFQGRSPADIKVEEVSNLPANLPSSSSLPYTVSIPTTSSIHSASSSDQSSSSEVREVAKPPSPISKRSKSPSPQPQQPAARAINKPWFGLKSQDISTKEHSWSSTSKSSSSHKSIPNETYGEMITREIANVRNSATKAAVKTNNRLDSLAAEVAKQTREQQELRRVVEGLSSQFKDFSKKVLSLLFLDDDDKKGESDSISEDSEDPDYQPHTSDFDTTEESSSTSEGDDGDDGDDKDRKGIPLRQGTPFAAGALRKHIPKTLIVELLQEEDTFADAEEEDDEDQPMEVDDEEESSHKERSDKDKDDEDSAGLGSKPSSSHSESTEDGTDGNNNKSTDQQSPEPPTKEDKEKGTVDEADQVERKTVGSSEEKSEEKDVDPETGLTAEETHAQLLEYERLEQLKRDAEFAKAVADLPSSEDEAPKDKKKKASKKKSVKSKRKLSTEHKPTPPRVLSVPTPNFTRPSDEIRPSGSVITEPELGMYFRNNTGSTLFVRAEELELLNEFSLAQLYAICDKSEESQIMRDIIKQVFDTKQEESRAMTEAKGIKLKKSNYSGQGINYSLPTEEIKPPGTVIVEPECGIYFETEHHEPRFLRVMDFSKISTRLLSHLQTLCDSSVEGIRCQRLMQVILDHNSSDQQMKVSMILRAAAMRNLVKPSTKKGPPNTPFIDPPQHKAKAPGTVELEGDVGMHFTGSSGQSLFFRVSEVMLFPTRMLEKIYDQCPLSPLGDALRDIIFHHIKTRYRDSANARAFIDSLYAQREERLKKNSERQM